MSSSSTALEGGVIVSAGGESITLGGRGSRDRAAGRVDTAFRAAPAGDSSTSLPTKSSRSSRPNAALYTDGGARVAKIEPWPEPVGGYRLRRYSTLEAYARGGMVHAFRTRKLMMVPYARFLEPRDETLTPHSHADFEQGSVALEGDWLHHLRVPWTAGEQAALAAGSASADRQPLDHDHSGGRHPHLAGDCGRGHAAGRCVRPPRVDFSERGWVDNAPTIRCPHEVARLNGMTTVSAPGWRVSKQHSRRPASADWSRALRRGVLLARPRRLYLEHRHARRA